MFLDFGLGKPLFLLWALNKKSVSSFKNLLQGNFGATWEANAVKTSFKLYYYLKCSYLFELASDQGLKLENTVSRTVKKRGTMFDVRKERRCRMGEIPWLLPLQQGGLHSSFQWQDRVALCGPFPSHSQHIHQHLMLTQRQQIYYTDI